MDLPAPHRPPFGAPPETHEGARWLTFTLIAVSVLGATARLWACRGDFWLDEILAVFGSSLLTSPLEILTRYTDSSNHHLYTLFLFLGRHDNWVIYRIPSLVAGILTIPAVWWAVRPFGKLEATFAAILTSGSYLLVHYSSEARGYSLVLLFATATFLATQRYAVDQRWRWALLVWLSTFLGFLSQLMFLFVFVAAVLWLPFHLIRTGTRWPRVLAASLQCFGVPAALLCLFYLTVVRKTKVGGGTDYELPDLLAKTLSYAGGGPGSAPFHFLAATATAAVFGWSIFRLWRANRTEWLLILVVVLVAPAVTLTLLQPEVLFPRYFLLSVFFGYIAASFTLADLYRSGFRGRVFATALMGLFLLGNGVNVTRLLKHGRGSYLEAMRFMEENTPGDLIAISGDHPFRNRMLVEFYKPYLRKGKQVVYATQYSGAPALSWYLGHGNGPVESARKLVRDPQGHLYALRRVFPSSSDLSGWHWAVYQRIGQ